MAGKRKGPNSKLTKVRSLLGFNVIAHFENSNSYIDGRFAFGENKIINHKSEFTEQRVGFCETGDDYSKSMGYYIIRENEPALRLYFDEIKDIEINNPLSSSLITINPEKDKPKTTDLGFNSFWIKHLYQQDNPYLENDRK